MGLLLIMPPVRVILQPVPATITGGRPRVQMAVTTAYFDWRTIGKYHQVRTAKDALLVRLPMAFQIPPLSVTSTYNKVGFRRSLGETARRTTVIKVTPTE